MSEKLARQFHEAYERLAPKFGYETRTETREFDPYTPNGRLMIAVCSEIDRDYRERLAEAEAEIAKLQSNWSNTIATHDETAARLSNVRKWALDGILLPEELEAIESGEWWENERE